MKKILVVDDDPAILDSLEIMLEDKGYEVETSNGKTLSDIYNNNADLILLDLWLSGTHGGSICAYLKSQEKTKHIPVIIITASKDGPLAVREFKADDYIEKPFEMNYLLEKIDSYLK